MQAHIRLHTTVPMYADIAVDIADDTPDDERFEAAKDAWYEGGEDSKLYWREGGCWEDDFHIVALLDAPGGNVIAGDDTDGPGNGPLEYKQEERDAILAYLRKVHASAWAMRDFDPPMRKEALMVAELIDAIAKGQHLSPQGVTP